MDLPDGVVAEIHVPVGDVDRLRVIRDGRDEKPSLIRHESGRCVIEMRGRKATVVVEHADVARAHPAAHGVGP